MTQHTTSHRSGTRAAARRASALALGVAGAVALGACGDTASGTLPPGAADPGIVRTPAGALQLARRAVATLQTAVPWYAVTSGLAADELQSSVAGSPAVGDYGHGPVLVDLRQATEESDNGAREEYESLQALRGQADLGVQALAAYAPDSPPALRGQLHAIRGYAAVLLADLFCSGIPLSTVALDGDYAYHAGSATAEVYGYAVAAFDSAIALSGDSARILNLARVGKGRALLALGRYADAAAAVAPVPTGFEYAFGVTWSSVPERVTTLVDGGDYGSTGAPFAGATVADQEGLNGLAYVTGADPRTASHDAGTNSYGVTQYFPDKFGDGSSAAPFVLASGVEARLIEAEAALRANDVTRWATILDDLRAAAGPAPIPALPADSTTGASPALRVDVTFAERAKWLFATGHRQGDLRRLIRQYGRRQDQVYPIGSYPGGQAAYGNAVNVPIPNGERVNPSYTGCLNRDA